MNFVTKLQSYKRYGDKLLKYIILYRPSQPRLTHEIRDPGHGHDHNKVIWLGNMFTFVSMIFFSVGS